MIIEDFEKPQKMVRSTSKYIKRDGESTMRRFCKTLYIVYAMV